MKASGLYVTIIVSFILKVNLAFSSDMSGTDFWFGFSENQLQPRTYVVVSSSVTTNGEISIPLANWNQSFSVVANSSVKIAIPYNLVIAIGNMTLENKGVHLTSNDPVYVSMYNGTGGSDDATSILPVETLGYKYIALTYLDPPNTNWGTPEILVVATENNTEINITPSGSLSNGSTGPITVVLNRGQTYQIQSHWMSGGLHGGNDLSGTVIESVCNSDGVKHKVAVFSGDKCSIVGGLDCKGCDHLVEQMWPINTLGTEFMVTAPVNRGTYYLKVVVPENGTIVSIQGVGTLNLNMGEWQQLEVTGQRYVTSNNPIAVGQYTKGQECSIGLGDPFFVQIVPNDQMQNNWEFFSYDSEQYPAFDSYINIVRPDVGGTPVFLNGVAIPSVDFQNVGNNLQVAKLPIASNDASFSVNSTGGFIAYVYAFGAANSYQYNSGISSDDLNADFDISYALNTINQSLFEDTICSCDSVEFIGSIDSLGYGFSWDFGDGQVDAGLVVNHNYMNGIYEITMYVIDQQGCKIDSVVKHGLVVKNCDISAPVSPICIGESVVLSSVLSGNSYLWNTGDTTASITVSPEETTTYSLHIDGGSIQICETVVVHVYEELPSQLVDTIICQTDDLELSLDNSFTNIIWSTGETTSLIQPDFTGLYTVEATDLNQCEFYDSAYITVKNCNYVLEMPNVFTPGTNQSNDLFLPINIDGIVSLETTILNRWGNVIYQTNDLQINWDGKTVHGDYVSEGVYYFILNYTTDTFEEGKLSGFIHVIPD